MPYDGRVQTHDERSRLTDAMVYGTLRPLSFWTLDLSAGKTRDLSASSSSYPFSFVVGTTTSDDRQYRFANALRFGTQGTHTITLAYERLDQDGFATSYDTSGVGGASFDRKVDSVMAGLHRAAVPVVDLARVPVQCAAR